jgi:argininosuccinate synthase
MTSVPDTPSARRIVLAYSSALADTDAVSWLAETHDAEVVALTLDFGQGRELEAVRDQALAAGAVRAHVIDVADAFANHFLLPALRAGALYADGRPMMSGLERALLAQKLVEIAAIEQTTTVAHGCSAGDRRVSTAAQTLNAAISVVALPAEITGSADCQMGPLAATRAERPSEPAYVELTFVAGAPTAINGIPMPLGGLVDSLNMLAGAHGVGPVQPLETPAAVVLYAAHQSLLDDGAAKEAQWASIGRAYAEIIDRGEWFSEARNALNATIDSLQRSVAGTIRLKLFNGACEIVGKKPLHDGKTLKIAETTG